MRRGLLIALTAAFVLSISILLAINAAGLRWELNQSTQAYLRDVTTQTANDIRGTMQHKIKDLQTVSSSISILRESGGDVQGLLDERAGLLEFEPLILVDKQGKTMTSQPVAVLSDDTIQALIRLPNIQASFQGETCANYLGGETDILYSTPVYTGGEVTEVYAAGTTFKHPEFAENGDTETGMAMLKFDNGTVAFLHVGRTAPHGYHTETEIVGTEGHLRVAGVPWKDRVMVYDQYGARQEIVENFPQRFAEAYLLEMVDFIDCVQKDRKPELTVYDGTKATIVTYAITDSFHSGKAVKVEY